MLITEKFGNLNTLEAGNKNIDILHIEWYETGKRILHKTTESGLSVVLKFLNENPDFREGDILWRDENSIIVIAIIPTTCIVVIPDSAVSTAAICYEIGNRHLPLFYEGDELLIPYNAPLYNLLHLSGYMMKVEDRKLSNPFKTTILPHVQVAGNVSAYSLQLSTLS